MEGSSQTPSGLNAGVSYSNNNNEDNSMLMDLSVPSTSDSFVQPNQEAAMSGEKLNQENNVMKQSFTKVPQYPYAFEQTQRMPESEKRGIMSPFEMAPPIVAKSMDTYQKPEQGFMFTSNSNPINTISDIRPVVPMHMNPMNPMAIRPDQKRDFESVKPIDVQVSKPTAFETAKPWEVETTKPIQSATTIGFGTIKNSDIAMTKPMDIETAKPMGVETIQSINIGTSKPTHIGMSNSMDMGVAKPIEAATTKSMNFEAVKSVNMRVGAIDHINIAGMEPRVIETVKPMVAEPPKPANTALAGIEQLKPINVIEAKPIEAAPVRSTNETLVGSLDNGSVKSFANTKPNPEVTKQFKEVKTHEINDVNEENNVKTEKVDKPPHEDICSKPSVSLAQTSTTPIVASPKENLSKSLDIGFKENKSKVVLKESKSALSSKESKSEKVSKEPQVPPVILSLNSRSRSSSHSSKSSKQTSPAPSPKPKPKPAVKKPPSKSVAPIYDGRNDFYCWICHKDGNVLCCELCPRVFHTKCLNMKKAPEGDWYCTVCEQITKAECEETQNKVMAKLSTKQLSEHLKFALKRLQIAGSDPFREPVDTEYFPDYLDYVFYPMDFQTLEENRKALKYGSTQAFMADVTWILHNCIVYNGHTKLSQLAKQIVKTAEFEMTEIEVCPECYLNAGNNRPNWFCEPCTVPHTLIWAKLQGFPHWPAKALRVENGSVDARFFGQHDRAWIPEANCYLYSKELPFPVKNKKKAGAKGGLDNAIAEAQLYIDNVVKKFGKFDYAPLRKPISETSLAINRYADQMSNSDSDSLRGDDKSLASQIKSLTQSSTDFSSLHLPPKKKSKIITTSGVHPKKLGRATKHSSLLGKTIQNLTSSIEDSIKGGLDELAGSCDESSTSTSESESSKETTPEKHQTEKNGSSRRKLRRNVESDSDSELVIDVQEDESGNKTKTPINLMKYSNSAKKQKKGEIDSKLRKESGVKRKLLEENGGTAAKLLKKTTDVSTTNSAVGNKSAAVFEKSYLKKKTPEIAGKNKSIGTKVKVSQAQQLSSPTAPLKKRTPTNPVAEGKSYLKNSSKVAPQKMAGKKLDKSRIGAIDKMEKQQAFSKKLQSFTIPKHKTNRTNEDDSNKLQCSDNHIQGRISSDVSINSSSTSASKSSVLHKYNERFMLMMKQMMSEVYDEGNKSASSDNRLASANQQLLQQVQNLKSKEQDQLKKISSLQQKIDRITWDNSQAVAELKHNHDLQMHEMRQSHEADKKQALDELRRKLDVEKKKEIEYTKSKQWCNNCGKEAVLYCCWNTSYCDYPCQEMHWVEHMSSCANMSQNDPPPATADKAGSEPQSDAEKCSDAESDDDEMVIDEERDDVIKKPEAPIKSILSKPSSSTTSSAAPLTGILKKPNVAAAIKTPSEPPATTTTSEMVDSFFSKSHIKKPSSTITTTTSSSAPYEPSQPVIIAKPGSDQSAATPPLTSPTAPSSGNANTTVSSNFVSRGLGSLKSRVLQTATTTTSSSSATNTSSNDDVITSDPLPSYSTSALSTTTTTTSATLNDDVTTSVSDDTSSSSLRPSTAVMTSSSEKSDDKKVDDVIDDDDDDDDMSMALEPVVLSSDNNK